MVISVTLSLVLVVKQFLQLSNSPPWWTAKKSAYKQRSFTKKRRMMQRWITITLQWKEVHTMVADEKLEPGYRA